MKNYYREQVQKHEARLALAKIGYEATLRECAADLTVASVEVSDLIIDTLNEARQAYNDMREELKSYQIRYQEAVDKELAREEANNGKD